MLRVPPMKVSRRTWAIGAYFFCPTFASAFDIAKPSSRLRQDSPRMMPSSSSTNTVSKTFKVLGLCGGIGSGKSSASKLLVSELGCLAHLEADALAHTVYRPGSESVKDIANMFGEKVVLEGTEEIDRKVLGSIVFNDQNEMMKLERLIWPHVKEIVMDRIANIKSDWENSNPSSVEDKIPVVVLEAAVLLDADWDDILDGIWVVTAPREQALQRLMETRGLSKEDSDQRIDAQKSRRGIGNLQEEVDKGVVTHVIKNNGSVHDLREALRQALLDPNSWKR